MATKTLPARRSIDPQALVAAAREAAPTAPPAVATPAPAKQTSSMFSVRLTDETIDALARLAIERGQSQRKLVALALQAIGVTVGPRDLEDQPQPRRRGRD